MKINRYVIVFAVAGLFCTGPVIFSMMKEVERSFWEKKLQVNRFKKKETLDKKYTHELHKLSVIAGKAAHATTLWELQLFQDEVPSILKTISVFAQDEEKSFGAKKAERWRELARLFFSIPLSEYAKKIIRGYTEKIQGLQQKYQAMRTKALAGINLKQNAKRKLKNALTKKFNATAKTASRAYTGFNDVNDYKYKASYQELITQWGNAYLKLLNEFGQARAAINNL